MLGRQPNDQDMPQPSEVCDLDECLVRLATHQPCFCWEQLYCLAVLQVFCLCAHLES